MSLTCALLATLLQQWARRYLKVTQVPYSQHKRALIRAFFAEGVEECLLPWVVETLPALLHISLFLFFAGLVVFLWNVNLTMFKSVLSWVTICSTLYGCFTLMPIFRHNSPYFTPLSSLMWGSAIGLAFLVSAASGLLLRYTFFCRRRSEWVLDFGESCYCLLSKGMQKTAEEAALKSPSAIVTRALMWTFEHLDEDHELERFFSGLPGLRSSKVIDDPLPRLAEEERQRFSQELSGLMGRTFSSDLPAPVKERRAMICAKAIDPIHFPKAFSVLDGILSKFQHSGPLVPRIVQVMREWGDHTNAISVAKATMSSIVARAQRRDKLWFILASDVLDIPETLLLDHAAHGDNLSFTILIHVTRQQFEHFWDSSWPRYDFSSVLVEASKFNIQDTSPELQHEFCALWNQVVRTVQDNGDRRMALYTLAQIRDVYIAIHQNTDSALTRLSVTTDWDGILTSYPVCNVPDHRDHPDSTPRLHDEAVPPPDNYISPPGPVQTSPQSFRVLSSSPNPVITHATRRSVDTLPRTTYLSSPERVASAPRPPPKSKASTSFPLYDVAVEHTPVSGTLLGDLSIPLSASPSPGSPVLDDIPIGLLLPPDSAVTLSDHALLRRISFVGYMCCRCGRRWRKRCFMQGNGKRRPS